MMAGGPVDGGLQCVYSCKWPPATVYSVRVSAIFGGDATPPTTDRRPLAMSYFLFKTEPGAYSFDDFLRDQETVWDGVTNPAAVKNLREMKPGAKWIFYHTGDERTAVGTGTVVSVDASNPKVPMVRVKVGKRLKTPKTLDQIKANKLFKDSPLLKIGRLSVAPLSEEQWEWFVG